MFNLVHDALRAVCVTDATDAPGMGVHTDGSSLVAAVADCFNSWVHARAAVEAQRDDGGTQQRTAAVGAPAADGGGYDRSSDVALLVVEANVWATVSRASAWSSESVGDALLELLHNCIGAVYVGLHSQQPVKGSAEPVEAQSHDSPDDATLFGAVDEIAERYQARQAVLQLFKARADAMGRCLGETAGSKPRFWSLLESLEPLLLRRFASIGGVLASGAPRSLMVPVDHVSNPLLALQRGNFVLTAFSLVWALALETSCASWTVLFSRYGERGSMWAAVARDSLGQRR